MRHTILHQNPKNFQDFENIQFPTLHLEAENPFGLVLPICLSKNPPLQFQIQRIRQAQTWTGVVVDRTWILTKARKSNIGPISTNGSRRENWRLLPIQQLPILKTLFLRLKKKQIQAWSLQLDKQFTYIAMLKTLEKDRWEPFLKVQIFWEGHI